MESSEREKALVEAIAEMLKESVLTRKGDTTICDSRDLRKALKAYSPYPTMCHSPEQCAGKGYCPREIACDD